MSKVCLVTGANGHLGNNLVRQLIEQGYTVKAGVRDTSNTAPFDGLDCELVYTDILNKQAMEQALDGVDILFQAAAVFKHWAADPEKEIVEANIKGTETVIEAAATAGVKQVIYISSVASVGHNGLPLAEDSWNNDLSNPYYRSKILSEQRAHALAKQHGLWMAVVLPAAMVGPNCHKLTPTMEFVDLLLRNQLPFDPQFFFNFVDVRDVASGAISAVTNGANGERYILANVSSSAMSEVVDALNEISTNLRVKQRRKAPKWLLLMIGRIQEIVSAITKKEAGLTVSQVETFFGVRQEYDISKARGALSYSPASPHQAIKAAGKYLWDKQ
jgi:dihydroflavonol-4-reductase